VPVIMRRLLSLPVLSTALVLPLAACGDNGSSGPTVAPSSAQVSGSASAAPTASAPASGAELDFATVQSLTAPRFQKDPNCGYGEWSENSTGIDEEFRASATTIQQFDCYKKREDVGGIPARVQQSIYVEFTDATAARSFAEDQSVLYPSLLAGSHVVVAGSGLESVDMRAYLADLQRACGCGEVTAPS
jgi:hypothetical protein